MMIKKFCVMLLAVVGIVFTGCANLQLAKDGETVYEIVKPDKPTAVDDYAMRELYNFFKQKTGASLAVASPDKISPDRKHIFIGISEPALKILGKNPLDGLKDQEYVVRCDGDNIFLMGKGMHGNFYAVVDFMENSLGQRWYTRLEKPVFKVERNLNISPLERRGGYDFVYRLPCYEDLFKYYQGLNMGFSERNADHKRRENKDLFPAGVVSLKYCPSFVHTSFGYIPPTPSTASWPSVFDWVANKDYFKTNPEFFTMTESGQRVPNLQLCFSNPGLRKELTKNIGEHIKRVGENVIIALDANDNPGTFCFCPACRELEKKYQSPGGPIYDYLIELCAMLKKEHPDVLVKTLAYRTAQTQKPPVMPEGKIFPDNLIVHFANVEDKLDADWNSPVNHSTYEDLLAWRKLTPHIWTWYYPNIYTAGCLVPFGNIGRLVNDIRMMKKADIEGVFYEFTTSNVWSGDGFTELQIYLYCKLAKDTGSDVPALIREFTDYQYGNAAPLVRKYSDELEIARKNMRKHMPLTITVINFDQEFSYLTDENIYRWQGYFDQMEKDAASDSRCLKNVIRLRRALEFATLGKWNQLSKSFPDYFKDYHIHKKRLGVINKWETPVVEDFEIAIKTGGKQSPLPSQFDGIDRASIRRLVPINTANNTKIPRTVLDSDAAFGYAATVELPDMPFNFGFYQNDTKTHGVRPKLEAGDIKPGVYQLYKLGEIKVTPACMIWFSSKSWMTNLQLGGRLYEPGEKNLWDAWVSLKFDGPSYGGKAKDDMVLCDQIILVRK